MRLNERLNLVIPVYGDDEKLSGYVHSMPVPLAVFEANAGLIGRTYKEIFSDGYGVVAGPRVAAMIMKNIGARHKEDDAGLLGEIVRLSCFIHQTKNGWEQVPLEHAIDNKMMDEGDVSEVMNAIVFFTVVSVMLPKKMVNSTVTVAASIWNALASPLAPTAWIASLRTSTKDVSTGETHPHHTDEVAKANAVPAQPVTLGQAHVTTKDGKTSTLWVPS